MVHFGAVVALGHQVAVSRYTASGAEPPQHYDAAQPPPSTPEELVRATRAVLPAGDPPAELTVLTLAETDDARIFTAAFPQTRVHVGSIARSAGLWLALRTSLRPGAILEVADGDEPSRYVRFDGTDVSVVAGWAAPPTAVVRVRAEDTETGPSDVTVATLCHDLAATLAEQFVDEPVVIDEDVRFTVYRPSSCRSERWERLLAFAHKTEPYEQDGEQVDPLAQVREQAAAVLGNDVERYATAAQDSRFELPRGSALRFVPDVPGVVFSPRYREFDWLEGVQREDFRFRAPAALEGRTVRGLLSVYLGTVLIADVTLALRIDSAAADETPQPSSAPRYRKIFASYSHRDAEIVENVRTVLTTMGDEVIRDIDRLRAGQVWNDELERFIREADVFQLFWSTNSMSSTFVTQEWEYALALRRPNFVRPVYWQQPRPSAPGVPPQSLDAIHFSYLPLEVARHAAEIGAASLASPSALPPGMGRSTASMTPSKPQPLAAHPMPPPPAPARPPRRRTGLVAATVGALAVAGTATVVGLSAVGPTTVVGGGTLPTASTVAPAPVIRPSSAPASPAPTRASATPPDGAVAPSFANAARAIDAFFELVDSNDTAGADRYVCADPVAGADPRAAYGHRWRFESLKDTFVTAGQRVIEASYSIDSSLTPVRFSLTRESGRVLLCGLTMNS